MYQEQNRIISTDAHFDAQFSKLRPCEAILVGTIMMRTVRAVLESAVVPAFGETSVLDHYRMRWLLVDPENGGIWAACGGFEVFISRSSDGPYLRFSGIVRIVA